MHVHWFDHRHTVDEHSFDQSPKTLWCHFCFLSTCNAFTCFLHKMLWQDFMLWDENILESAFLPFYMHTYTLHLLHFHEKEVLWKFKFLTETILTNFEIERNWNIHFRSLHMYFLWTQELKLRFSKKATVILQKKFGLFWKYQLCTYLHLLTYLIKWSKFSMSFPLILLILIVFFSHSINQQSWINQVCSRRPVGSTDQVYPSCFYFKISWILKEWPWNHFFGSCGFLQGLRS